MRPRLTISMMQLEHLPNPYYLSKRIKESYKFIDENKDITLDRLPAKWINFWKVKEVAILSNEPFFPPDEERYNHYSITISQIIFSYIYARYYRDNDFADPGNYFRMYVGFQKLLLIAASMPKREHSRHLSIVKPFDLRKLDANIDWLSSIY